MNYPQAVFFDFDGVVLDSVHMKTEAFGDLFAEYGERIRQQVIAYHLANCGISRIRKFEYYYEHLLQKPLSQEELASLAERFTRLTLDKILAAPFIAGAKETLEELHSKGVPCYVASGTPQDELRHIIDERGLCRFFIEAHGSPRTKNEILADLLDRFGHDPASCVFAGDAMTDYKAANKAGMPFLGIVRDGNPFPPGTPTAVELSGQAICAAAYAGASGLKQAKAAI